MLLTRLHRPQSSSQAWATVIQLHRPFSNGYSSDRPKVHKGAPTSTRAKNGTSSGVRSGFRRVRIESDTYGDATAQQAQSVQTAEPPPPEASPPSLFEELFPEIAKKSAKAVKQTTQREAYLPRDFDWAKSWPSINKKATNTSSRTEPSPSDLPQTSRSPPASDISLDKQRRDASVLVLSGASPNLSESDFTRLSPKGHHIDGWLSGILKVIPGRDPQTLEPLGHFFILFTSAYAARAYRDNVNRLHHLSRTYTPNSIDSGLPPPPGYLKEGEDLHKLMSDFTLAPASMRSANIRMLDRPLRPSVEKLIADGGHPALVRRQRECENLVLVNFENGGDYSFVSEYDIRRWLSLDGQKRGANWELVDGDNKIVRLDGKTEEEMDNGESLGTREDWRNTYRTKKKLPSRFILSFKDVQEARRFVREWHKRRFEVETRAGEIRSMDREGDVPTIINATLLW